MKESGAGSFCPRLIALKIPGFFSAWEEILREPEILTDFRAAH
jgi:hypothetical protein